MTLHSEIEADNVSALLINISSYTDQCLVDQFRSTTSAAALDSSPVARTTAPSWKLDRLPVPVDTPRLSRTAASAVDQERDRIARDIHDVSGRYIISMLFQLAAIEKNQADPSLLQALAELRVTLTGFSENLQDIANSERRGVPRARHLATAVADLVSEWEGQIGIPARFRHRGLTRAAIDDRTAEAAFRIIQEGLTNIAKHAASANLVTVALVAEADRLTLEIEDDGEGPGPAPRCDEGRHQHCGIAGMLQRVSELGGTFSIRPRGALPGTRLVATMPLQAAGPPGQEGGAS
jgi:signal transduction histidine kinase